MNSIRLGCVFIARYFSCPNVLWLANPYKEHPGVEAPVWIITEIKLGKREKERVSWDGCIKATCVKFQFEGL